VRTPKETIQLCASDLDTATSLVTARVIAGNAALGEEVISATNESWKKRGREWLVELHARVLDRYNKDGEVAFLLEPNLKEGMGGLRDIHALHWAVRAGLDLLPGDAGQLERCNDVLLVHRGVKDISEIASRMWYPVWDTGVKLGHSVRTPKDELHGLQMKCGHDLIRQQTGRQFLNLWLLGFNSSMAKFISRTMLMLLMIQRCCCELPRLLLDWELE